MAETGNHDGDDDASRRSQELESLRAFYENEILEDTTDEQWFIRVGSCVVLEMSVPPNYPSTSAPALLLRAPPWILDQGRAVELANELVELFTPDSEVAIMWAEHCRAELNVASSNEDTFDVANAEAETIVNPVEEDDTTPPTMVNAGEVVTFRPPTSKHGQSTRHFDASVVGSQSNRRTIHRGEPYHPPKSGPSETMVARVAHVTSMDHVNWVLAELLLNDRKVARATHNMIAYRFFDQDKHCLVSDNDDDGEKGAGSKLAALLDMSDAKDVLVVVSRWFGGIHLGPSRFKYIACVARDLLQDEGFIGTPADRQDEGGGTTVVKRKGKKGSKVERR
eukprot:scaffold9421_cov47-Attheya_sp.AAC.8